MGEISKRSSLNFVGACANENIWRDLSMWSLTDRATFRGRTRPNSVLIYNASFLANEYAYTNYATPTINHI